EGREDEGQHRRRGHRPQLYRVTVDRVKRRCHDTSPFVTYDFVIIGSGFGGSVSALRLVEKGYRVLLLEKGRRFGPEDFPKTNWELRRWMWMPDLGLRGIFKMSFFPHLP